MGIIANFRANTAGKRIAGMRLIDGRLWTARSGADPDYLVLVTDEQKREYLRPIEHDLQGAHATFVPVSHARNGALILPVGPIAALVSLPKIKGFVVVVTLADGQKLYGQSNRHIRWIRDFCQEINRSAIHVAA